MKTGLNDFNNDRTQPTFVTVLFAPVTKTEHIGIGARLKVYAKPTSVISVNRNSCACTASV